MKPDRKKMQSVRTVRRNSINRRVRRIKVFRLPDGYVHVRFCGQNASSSALISPLVDEKTYPLHRQKWKPRTLPLYENSAKVGE